MKEDKDLFINVFDDDFNEEENERITYNSFEELEPADRGDDYIELEEVEEVPVGRHSSGSPKKKAESSGYKNERQSRKEATSQSSENGRNQVKKRKKKKSKALTMAKRVLIVIGTTLLLLVVFLYVVMWILVKGPSDAAKNLFVCAVNESSAMGFCANIYLSQSEIDEILERNKLQELEQGEVSNTDLVVIPDTFDETTPDIELIDIKGTKYRGKMLIVKDPSRVSVGTVDVFYEGAGTNVKDTCERYGAIAGINGGDFVDEGSYAYTAMPIGCVISQGKHLM